jgi:hypothetical protein
LRNRDEREYDPEEEAKEATPKTSALLMPVKKPVGIDQIDGIVGDVAVAVQRLRVEHVRDERVRADKPGEFGVVVPAAVVHELALDIPLLPSESEQGLAASFRAADGPPGIVFDQLGQVTVFSRDDVDAAQMIVMVEKLLPGRLVNGQGLDADTDILDDDAVLDPVAGERKDRRAVTA